MTSQANAMGGTNITLLLRNLDGAGHPWTALSSFGASWFDPTTTSPEGTQFTEFGLTDGVAYSYASGSGVGTMTPVFGATYTGFAGQTLPNQDSRQGLLARRRSIPSTPPEVLATSTWRPDSIRGGT